MPPQQAPKAASRRFGRAATAPLRATASVVVNEDGSSGKKVFLRKLAASDRTEFLRLAHASRNMHHPWVAPPLDAKTFGKLLRRTGDRFASLLVCERKTETIAGLINVSEIVRGTFCSAYLGYYAHIAYARKGYMTEGISLVCRYDSRSSPFIASKRISSRPTYPRSGSPRGAASAKKVFPRATSRWRVAGAITSAGPSRKRICEMAQRSLLTYFFCQSPNTAPVGSRTTLNVPS